MEWIVGLGLVSVSTCGGFILAACLSMRANEEYCMNIEQALQDYWQKRGYAEGYQDGKANEKAAQKMAQIEHCDAE
jgi:hypothetical protein